MGFIVLLMLIPGAFCWIVPRPVDCHDVYIAGNGQSDLQIIYPSGPTCPILVSCDIGPTGKWTVLQRRVDGVLNFYRGWEDYKTGFGHASGEHWLGLETIYQLTSRKNYKLRIDLEDFDGHTVYVEYSHFSVGSELERYSLNVSGYINGGAGDSLLNLNGQSFSTYDSDHSNWWSNSAMRYVGAWWYRSSHRSNLNGLYLRGQHSHYGIGVNWNSWRAMYYSVKSVTMKIAPSY